MKLYVWIGNFDELIVQTEFDISSFYGIVADSYFVIGGSNTSDLYNFNGFVTLLNFYHGIILNNVSDMTAFMSKGGINPIQWHQS